MIMSPDTLMTVFWLMFLFLVTMFPVLYLASNWREIQLTRKANCLLWKHPENTKDHVSALELINMESPPGPSWPYKAFFFLSERSIKWCWEVKKEVKTGQKKGNVSFKIEPFNPDDHIGAMQKTSASLFSAVDWEWCKPILGRTAPLMEKLAQGGIVIMGGVALFGIMALLDMLGKDG